MPAILLAILLALAQPPPLAASEEVVATINGQAILLEEILPAQEAVDGAYLMETGQGPQSDRDMDLLAEIRFRLQRQALAFQLRDRLRQGALSRFEVEVGEQEIAAKKQEIFRRVDIERFAKPQLKSVATT